MTYSTFIIITSGDFGINISTNEIFSMNRYRSQDSMEECNFLLASETRNEQLNIIIEKHQVKITFNFDADITAM